MAWFAALSALVILFWETHGAFESRVARARRNGTNQSCFGR